MKASVTFDNGMAFSCEAGKEFSVRMDANPKVGGAGSAYSPMQHVLMSLGGCTGMDIISILRKKRQDVRGFEIHLEAEQASEPPRVFTHILVNHIIRGKEIVPAAVERAIELSVEKYCSVQAMLAKSAEIEHQYEIVEVE